MPLALISSTELIRVAGYDYHACAYKTPSGLRLMIGNDLFVNEKDVISADLAIVRVEVPAAAPAAPAAAPRHSSGRAAPAADALSGAGRDTENGKSH